MDKSVLLSAEQLFLLKLSYQEEKKMRPRRRNDKSTKLKDLPGSEAAMANLVNQVESRLNDRFSSLKAPRVRFSNDMGLAEWCPLTRSSKVISAKKRSPWMGFMDNSELKYTPEETLFLLETENIIVNYKELPMSLQIAYQLILTDEYLSTCYKVYSYLTRLGFKLKSLSHTEKSSSTDTLPFKHNDSIKRPSLSAYSPIQASRFNLKLVMMPLQRWMFLKGTDFERPSTWAEYNRIVELRQNPSAAIKDEEAIVLELGPGILSGENILDQLPNKSLIDYSTNLKPLIDQTKAIDIHKLHQIFKEAGPQEQNYTQFSPSHNKPEMKYQVYLPERKSFSANDPDYHLTITEYTDHPPEINELLSLKERYGRAKPLFAVTSQYGFNIYTLEPFDCWDELPMAWDSSKKQ